MAGPLSICIPTYNRPDLLAKALASVTSQARDMTAVTELVVSDNSTDTRSEAVYRRLTADYPGPHRYYRNDDSPGMVGNFNYCVQRATARYVLILHDDDWLLDGGLRAIHSALAGTALSPMLFGVEVTNERGAVIKRQRYGRQQLLSPQDAVLRLVRNSSFVRFPAIVVPREHYTQVGPFDDSYRGATDMDMWARIFARWGVTLQPATTVAYYIHQGADTTTVFDERTLGNVLRVFDRLERDDVLDAGTLRKARADWCHQFILAGAVRHMRAGDRRGARHVLDLFDSLPHRDTSPRWIAVRVGLELATVGAR